LLGAVDSSDIHYHSYTNRYLVGPTAELRLPFGLGVEADALYRHYSFWSAGTVSAGAGTLRTNGRSSQWEFPLLAKYRLPTKLARPFVAAGFAWDTLEGFGQSVIIVSPVPIRPPTNLNQPIHNTTSGFVIGGGLEVRTPYVRVSPEVRYTNWGDPHFLSSNGGFSSHQGQTEVMVGISF
jgi:opacity protein-like surface antigen